MKVIRFFLGLAIVASSMIVLADNNECKGSYKERTVCMAKREAEIIKRYPQLMERKEGDLILKPLQTSNSPKVFKNVWSNDNEGNNTTYWLAEYYPQYKISYIKVVYYEGHSAYIYHHEYGSYQEVVGDIAFSKDGKHMVAYNEDIEAEYTPNIVTIFSLGKNWPERLSSFENMGFGVEKAEFIANDRVLLKTAFWNNHDIAHGECVLKQFDRVWEFERHTCTTLIKKQPPLPKSQGDR